MNNGAEQYLHVVHRIARVMFEKAKETHPDISLDDCMSWGFLGLVAGLQDYNQQKTPDKKRYLSYRITWAIYDGMKEWGKGIVGIPKRQKETNPETRFDDIFDGFEPSADCDQDRAVFHSLLREQISKLPHRSRRLIYQRFWQGLSFDEMGAMENLTKQRCQQLLKKAIEQLRAGFKGLELERVARQHKIQNIIPRATD